MQMNGTTRGTLPPQAGVRVEAVTADRLHPFPVSPGPAWHQFLASMECPDCRPAHDRVWTKADADGRPVTLAVEPCAKHLRMFDQQGWVPSVSTPVL